MCSAQGLMLIHMRGYDFRFNIGRVLVLNDLPTLEVELEERLAAEPGLVRGAQEVLRRHGLEDGDSERQVLRALFVAAQVEIQSKI